MVGAVNPLALLGLLKSPWIYILLVGLAFGWEYTTVKERDATIANYETQRAKDIAAAEQAVRAEKDADKVKTDRIITDLHATQKDTEEKLNAASIALATAPVQVIPQGCPDPNRSAASVAFDRGLPSDH